MGPPLRGISCLLFHLHIPAGKYGSRHWLMPASPSASLLPSGPFWASSGCASTSLSDLDADLSRNGERADRKSSKASRHGILMLCCKHFRSFCKFHYCCLVFPYPRMCGLNNGPSHLSSLEPRRLASCSTRAPSLHPFYPQLVPTKRQLLQSFARPVHSFASCGQEASLLEITAQTRTHLT